MRSPARRRRAGRRGSAARCRGWTSAGRRHPAAAARCSRAYAASTSGTCTDSSPHEPSCTAPVWIGRAPGPTATSRETLSRTASRPISSWAVSESGPELEHLAQHGPRAPAAGHPHERLQSRPHRVGVGVVGVVDDAHAVGAVGDLHAPAAHGPGSAQRRGDRVDGHGELARHRRDGQGVGHVVLAEEREPHRRRALGRHERERGARLVVEGDVVGPHVAVGRPPDEHARARGCARAWPARAGRRR